MFRIGIIGGGQLAGLLAAEVNRQGAVCYSLDPDAASPAVGMGARGIVGHRHSADDIRRLAEQTDIVTVDLEDINVDALAALEAEGVTVFPRPATLRNLTNKLTQKQTLEAAGLPTSQFLEVDGSSGDLSQLGWPVVQKAATGGYDGRGVVVLKGPQDLAGRLQVPGFIEAFVPNMTELAVMVARDRHGHVVTWQPVEMEFDPVGNLLTYLLAPARVEAAVAEQAQALACAAVEAFDGVGIFGVEMFLTAGGDLLINEIAPRTHNSGHYTIDACETSQFLALYQILADQPLGDTRQHQAAAMYNVLGEPGYEGETVVEGLDTLAAMDGVHAYLYGKQNCFGLRKMGHVTVTADTLQAAISIADQAKPILKVRGRSPIGRE